RRPAASTSPRRAPPAPPPSSCPPTACCPASPASPRCPRGTTAPRSAPASWPATPPPTRTRRQAESRGGTLTPPTPSAARQPCAEPPLPRARAPGPLPGRGGGGEGAGAGGKGRVAALRRQQPRYPSVESNDLEPDNSTSEDTGSSEGPSPGDALDRYCNHLGYEPESLGDNLYVCIPCGKGFPSSEQLNAHVEAHNEEELYHKAAAEQAVPFLDKGGPGLGDILHLGLKPFACDACGMRFTRQYRLTEHMRIHSGEKPYECQVCGGKFAQQRNLISHMKMHAAGPDGKAKLDFPDSVYAMARLTADQLGLKQEKAAELLSHTSHFLSDPKAMERTALVARPPPSPPPPGPTAAPGTGAGGEAQAVTPG
uniref:HIC ZBTB transcriptional repressor 1 n=1 Tax=Anas platyrhynchos TaxID=8839 RepID=A0A8B9R2G0_ANAPL